MITGNYKWNQKYTEVSTNYLEKTNFSKNNLSNLAYMGNLEAQSLKLELYGFTFFGIIFQKPFVERNGVMETEVMNALKNCFLS